jgi:hypothetical protein
MTDTLKDEIIALTMEAVEKAYQMGLTAGARAEREACAKLIESRKTGANELMDAVRDMEAKTIRKRGQA